MIFRELEHLLREAGGVARDNEFVIIGSVAILGKFPDAPKELLTSVEADIYPRNRLEGSDVIERELGEGSEFHDRHGYHAHAVTPELATLPDGWETRLIRFRSKRTKGVTGWCLEPHDLAVSKLVVGRKKDTEFIYHRLVHQLVEPSGLRARIRLLPVDQSQQNQCVRRLQRIQGRIKDENK